MNNTLAEPMKQTAVRRLNGMIYGRKFDGRAAYICISYNHSTRAAFQTVFVDANGVEYVRDGHPKTNGVLKLNNWSIDPELSVGANW